MDQSDERELYRRISQLENAVSEIKEILEQYVPHAAESVRPPEPPPPPEPTPAPPPPPPPPTAPAAPPLPPSTMPSQAPTPAPRPVSPALTKQPTFQFPDIMRQSEFWLKIVGIGLLLFGVAFAFKYSIEQGWINPLVRHLFGLAVGGILLILGLRLYDKRRPFAQVLLGGSIGTFYITCFSAFQLFELISHTVAFACMIAITAAAFYVAIRQDDAIFSLIGTAGALGTPFLLYTGSGNLPGLVLYTSLVLAGTAAVYFFKGWRLLLWLSVIGCWIVLSIGIESGDLTRPVGSDTDRWAMQAGILFAWLLFWLTPLLRKIACLKPNARWRADRLGIGDSSLTVEARKVMDRHVHLFAVSSPLIALMLSVESWPTVSNTVFGWGAMGATILYWLTARFLRGLDGFKNLIYTHVAVGALLMTISFCLLLDGDVLLFTLAGEAALFHLLARRLNDSKITAGGHILFGIIGFWLLTRLLLDSGGQPAMFNAQALTDLWVVALAAATTFIVRRSAEMRGYLIGSAIALALLFHRELTGELLFLAIVVEAGALHLVARRLKDEVIDAVSNGAYASLGIWLLVRLADIPPHGTAFINYQAGVELALIASGLAIAWFARSAEERRYYLLASFAFLAGSFWRELDGNVLLIMLLIETATLHWLARHLSDRNLALGAHLLMAGIGAWLLERLFTPRIADLAMLNATALTDLATIGTAVGVCVLFKSHAEKLFYRLAAHLAILIWFYRELVPFENGQGFVSAAWGVYGIVMLLVGLRLNISRLRLVGLGTMMLVVAKLFLVDLARLETIWRVLLFIGFGAIFLTLSYYFPKLWKGETGDKAGTA